MLKFKNRFFVATLAVAILTAPTIANVAARPASHTKSMHHSDMMSSRKMTRMGKTGMSGGGMKGMMGMMGMMAMMNACTRVMNKMADNMGHSKSGAHHSSMMGKSSTKTKS